MKIFRWSSKALAGYYSGDILVCAEDVYEARKKALDWLAKHDGNSGLYWYDEESEQEKKLLFVVDIESLTYDVDEIFLIAGGD